MANNEAEKELIRKAAQGDEESFEALIFACKGKGYNLTYRYLGNQEDALDALQESFIKIYKNLASFKFESSFDTWVYRIIVNTCHDLHKKNKSRPHTEPIHKDHDGEYTLDLPDDSDAPEVKLMEKESSKYLIQCLEQMVSEQKEILILRDIQGYSYEEISSLLDCSLGTVKSRISRARQKLKEIYLNGSPGQQHFM
jgi:RNA polymerase sigma-70 factor (ECF subfamily)